MKVKVTGEIRVVPACRPLGGALTILPETPLLQRVVRLFFFTRPRTRLQCPVWASASLDRSDSRRTTALRVMMEETWKKLTLRWRGQRPASRMHPAPVHKIVVGELMFNYGALLPHSSSLATDSHLCFVYRLGLSYSRHVEGNVSRQGLYGSYLKSCATHGVKAIK